LYPWSHSCFYKFFHWIIFMIGISTDKK
jgi:hypothetical protein